MTHMRTEKKRADMGYTCENSRRNHTCRGPLYVVRDNKKERVLCFDTVKHLILTGHEVQIIKNVPRKAFEEKKRLVNF
jgi:hypothetical protein